MIGKVERLQALLSVTFLPEGYQEQTVEFVIDTGFVGTLSLPAAMVAALELPYLHEATASLADDSRVGIPVHSATILWNGRERGVRVLAMGQRPLLGTVLLEGTELLAQFTDSGVVTVDDL